MSLITKYDKYEGEIIKRNYVDNITDITVRTDDTFLPDVLCGRKVLIFVECEEDK